MSNERRWVPAAWFAKEHGGLVGLSEIAGYAEGLERIEPAQLRLMIRVARMYYESELRQNAIAERLHISQTKVSRLLRKANEIGIVKTVVATAPQIYVELEEGLESRYGLREAVVVECYDDDSALFSTLGGTLARYLESTLDTGDVLGFSSWSETLLSMVNSMGATSNSIEKVVQIVGGVGEASSQSLMNRAMSRLADLTRSRPLFLPAPGLLETPDARAILMSDRALADVMKEWRSVTVAVFGIGSVEPSPLLRESGNSLSEENLEELIRRGAVGDVSFRYFDENGDRIVSPIDDRVVGIDVDELFAIPRRIAAAGGSRKLQSIRAAVRGGWCNILITDVKTARALLAQPN